MRQQQVVVPDYGVKVIEEIDRCENDPVEIFEIESPEVVIIKHLEPRHS